jgi:hypothetical protein
MEVNMARWVFLGALLVWPLLTAPAIAQEPDSKAMEERIKKLEESVKTFQEHERREREREKEPLPSAGGPPAGGVGPITDIKVERKGEEKVPLGFSSTGSGRLIYAKPFLAAPKSTIGGYADIKYGSLTSPTLDNPSRNSFNQERMVPFIYADITDRIKFAVEIEMERGGTNSPGTTVNGTSGSTASGSVQLEFAQFDYLLTEAINLRAGMLLMPVGKFNLLHDSPLNDLPDRPMVDRLVIPSTWFESGAGIYGTLYPTRLSKLDYELYAVNGMGCNAGGTSITDTSGMRNCRGSVSRDNNDDKGVVGRVAFSPMLGVEVAGSSFYSTYSNRNAAGVNNQNNNIGIYAIDWTLQRGPWELIGEAAWSRITGNQGTTLATQGPDGMSGYYIQANYHFMPEILKRLAPSHFSDASTFTAVVRWETVDTDTGDKTRTSTGALSNQRDLERLTLGLNFRPIEDTVIKFSYLFSTQKNTSITNSVNNPTGTIPTRIDGNGFLMMLASYF